MTFMRARAEVLAPEVGRAVNLITTMIMCDEQVLATAKRAVKTFAAQGALCMRCAMRGDFVALCGGVSGVVHMRYTAKGCAELFEARWEPSLRQRVPILEVLPQCNGYRYLPYAAVRYLSVRNVDEAIKQVAKNACAEEDRDVCAE